MTTPVAKLLQIQFQGYFMCRIATDPDPTNEQRGVSGYTLALVQEDVLDQVIRTQLDPEKSEDREFLEKNLRAGAGDGDQDRGQCQRSALRRPALLWTRP